jgi:hypothetical protein
MRNSDTVFGKETPGIGALEEFESESPEVDPPFFSSTVGSVELRPARRLFVYAVLVMGAIVVGAGLWVRSSVIDAEPIPPLGGSLSVESDAERIDVSIDGVPRGTTPLTLSLLEGNHRLLVRHGVRTRDLSVTVRRNVSTVYHITWPSDADLVDNAVVDSRAPGEHDVVAMQSGATVQRRALGVEPGATTSLVIGATARDDLASGWLVTRTSAPLQVLEDGKVVGSTESDRILVPVGIHTFEFVNEALGFRASETIRIAGGQTSSLAVDLPEGSMSVNAAPWAEVWLDGQPVGDTPIANLPTTVGSHELIFRHPQFGERHVTALVTLKEPSRVAVDMIKPD